MNSSPTPRVLWLDRTPPATRKWTRFTTITTSTRVPRSRLNITSVAMRQPVALKSRSCPIKRNAPPRTITSPVPSQRKRGVLRRSSSVRSSGDRSASVVGTRAVSTRPGIAAVFTPEVSAEATRAMSHHHSSRRSGEGENLTTVRGCLPAIRQSARPTGSAARCPAPSVPAPRSAGRTPLRP